MAPRRCRSVSLARAAAACALLLASCASLALAATAGRGRVQAVPQGAAQGPLLAKDAKTRGMDHPAFANAGRRKGIEIWRIENFEPVPVPSREVGKFYTGDSYIVLNTKEDNRNRLSWDIHYWLGSKTTQDESGAAAILTVALDDKLGGGPVEHREVQGYESTQFLGYFKPAIRYLDGGHATGFQHVETNAGAEKRLFQVKGSRNVRVKQVEPSISAMNKGDCFVLDKDQDIFVYVGEKAKRVERLKAISVANQIRDQDHNGRGRVDIIDEFSGESDVDRFFAALGSGSRAAVPEESAGGDDQAFERSDEQGVTLYKVSDATGSLKITPIPQKPLKQEFLEKEECYILDSVAGGLYVWVGKDCNQKERTEAMNKANEFIRTKNYPSWVHVTRVPAGGEPTAFKQYFQTWQDRGMSHPRLIRSPSDAELYASDEDVARAKARRVGKTGAARGFIPDDGTGDVRIYRIEDLELAQVDAEDARNGQFYQGDSYLLQYDYQPEGKGQKHIIYYWLGKDSTLDEIGAAAIHAVRLDDEIGGAAIQVRVPQGEEPLHFLKIFQGKFITHLGGKASGFKNTNEKDTYDDDGVRLYRVYGNRRNVDMRAAQVPEKASSLQEDDVFMLETPAKVFVWFGKDSSEEEREVASEFADVLFGQGKRRVDVQQGEEPNDFWTYLGGKPEETAAEQSGWKRNLHKRTGFESRLHHANVDNRGVVTFQELWNYEQEDLTDDDVFLMDSGDEIYIWFGRNAPDREKKASGAILQEYLKTDHLERTPISAVVFMIKQGREPYAFKKLFDEWDRQMWEKQVSYDEIKNRMIENNRIL